MIDLDLAKALLEFNGWESFDNSYYKKGSVKIQIGWSSAGGRLQRFNGFGWGEIRNIDSVSGFAAALSDVSKANECAIEALSEVADRLNDTIIYAFGDFGDWDNHSGYDNIPEGLTIDPGAAHRETLAQVWKLREDVNSVLAGMV